VLGDAVGEDVERSPYVMSQAMAAVVDLAARQWAEGREMNWPKLIEASAQRPEIMDAAQQMAGAVYRPVTQEADARDRIGVSLMAGFWKLHALCDSVQGLTPTLAGNLVRDIADVLRQYPRPVDHPDLQVGWLQGSIGRMVDFACADMRARFARSAVSGDRERQEAQMQEVLAAARSAFEGVETYAQQLLVDAVAAPQSRPTGGA
jgi:hypothetical protein